MFLLSIHNLRISLIGLLNLDLILHLVRSMLLKLLKVDLEEHNHEDRKATVREKPYISKAERRKLKKGQKTSTSDAGGDHGKEEMEESNVSTSQPDKDVKNSRPTDGKISRGQKGKLKKMKEKYADQDEEERSIHMALLASAGRAHKIDNESADTGKGMKPVTGPEKAPKICYKCKKAGHLSHDCPEHPDETIRSHSNGLEDQRVDLKITE